MSSLAPRHAALALSLGLVGSTSTTSTPWASTGPTERAIAQQAADIVRIWRSYASPELRGWLGADRELSTGTLFLPRIDRKGRPTGLTKLRVTNWGLGYRTADAPPTTSHRFAFTEIEARWLVRRAIRRAGTAPGWQAVDLSFRNELERVGVPHHIRDQLGPHPKTPRATRSARMRAAWRQWRQDVAGLFAKARRRTRKLRERAR